MFVEEDDAPTVKARLVAAGADLAFVDLVDDATNPQEYVELPEGVDRLRATLEAARESAQPYDIVLFDNLANRVGRGINLNKPREVRRMLTPLAKIAHEFGCCILLILHWRKAAGTASERTAGSGDILNVFRAAVTVGPHPELPDVFVIARGKKNLAGGIWPSLSYSIATSVVTGDDGNDVEVGRIVWGDRIDLTADDIAAASAARDNSPRGEQDRDNAADFLRTFLADAPRSSKDVWAASDTAGITDGALKRASTLLNVIKDRERKPQPRSFWGLRAWNWSAPPAYIPTDASASSAVTAPADLTETVQPRQLSQTSQLKQPGQSSDFAFDMSLVPDNFRPNRRGQKR